MVRIEIKYLSVIEVSEMIRIGSDRMENFVVNGENAGDQHLLIFTQCFQKTS